MMGIKLLETQNDQFFNSTIAAEAIGQNKSELTSVFVVAKDWETIKAQLLAYDLVKIEYLQTISKSMALFWSLTEYGKKMALLIRTVPKT